VRSARRTVGDGIAIGVEANESLGVDMDRHDLVGGRQRVGQGEQARALLGKDIGDSAWGQHGMWARMGNVGDELLSCWILPVHAEDGAASEEAVAQVANGALDTALVLRADGRHTGEAVRAFQRTVKGAWG